MLISRAPFPRGFPLEDLLKSGSLHQPLKPPPTPPKEGSTNSVQPNSPQARSSPSFGGGWGEALLPSLREGPGVGLIPVLPNPSFAFLLVFHLFEARVVQLEILLRGHKVDNGLHDVLDSIDLTGAVVSIDAMGTQTDIA